jgi:hypothetical protein
MANSIHSPLSDLRLGTTENLRIGHFPSALTWLAVGVFFSGLVLLSLFRTSSGESIVVQCDKSAVIAASAVTDNADKGKQWRLARQQAFHRCMDESFRTLQNPRP